MRHQCKRSRTSIVQPVHLDHEMLECCYVAIPANVLHHISSSLHMMRSGERTMSKCQAHYFRNLRDTWSEGCKLGAAWCPGKAGNDVEEACADGSSKAEERRTWRESARRQERVKMLKPGDVSCRLIVDCMGHWSTIAAQARKGRKPHGVALVVGGMVHFPIQHLALQCTGSHRRSPVVLHNHITVCVQPEVLLQ